MSLRTPNPWNNLQSLVDLQRIKERMSVYQQQISTGKRIVRLGEDPTGAALVVDFKGSIARNDQYLKQVESAVSFLSSSETVLDSANNSLTRLLELGQLGLSDTFGVSELPKMAEEVDGLRKHLVSLANSKEQGKYIFAGTRTTTQPFVDTGGAVNYAGNNGLITLDVGVTAAVTTNLPGSEVFQGPGGQGSATDMFQAVTDMRDAMLTGDRTLLKSAYDRVQQAHDRLQNSITELGGRQAALDQIRDTLGSFNQSLTAIQKTYEDVDYYEAIMNFAKEQTAQQTALSALAKSNKTHLFEYLG